VTNRAAHSGPHRRQGLARLCRARHHRTDATQRTEYRDVVLLILHTATRSEETRSARWKNVDPEARLWTIPPEQTKAGEAHAVPLSKERSRSCCGFVRNRRRASSSSLRPPQRATWTPRRGVVEAIRHASGVADFGLHDLRRTVATRLAGMKNPPHIVDAILGHRAPGLTRTYQVYTPLPEMRTALEAWSASLDRILNGKARPERSSRWWCGAQRRVGSIDGRICYTDTLTLEAFDAFLAQRGLHFEGIVVGGAALNLMGVIARATKDCDVLDLQTLGREDFVRAKLFAVRSMARHRRLHRPRSHP